jgi:hypothetical protein
MFELGVYKQIPLSNLGTGFIFDHLALDSIEHRDNFLRLLLGLELLILLDDGVTLLELSLVSGDILSGEGLTTECLENGNHICCNKVVFGKSNVLKSTVRFKNVFHSRANDSSSKIVVAQVNNFEALILESAAISGEQFANLLKVVIGET